MTATLDQLKEWLDAENVIPYHPETMSIKGQPWWTGVDIACWHHDQERNAVTVIPGGSTIECNFQYCWVAFFMDDSNRLTSVSVGCLEPYSLIASDLPLPSTRHELGNTLALARLNYMERDTDRRSADGMKLVKQLVEASRNGEAAEIEALNLKPAAQSLLKDLTGACLEVEAMEHELFKLAQRQRKLSQALCWELMQTLPQLA